MTVIWKNCTVLPVENWPVRSKAEEIVHDVLLDLWSRRAELDIEHLPAYLEKAVRFKVINFVNREKLPRFMEVFESLLFSPYSAFKDEAFNQPLESWVETLPKSSGRYLSVIMWMGSVLGRLP